MAKPILLHLGDDIRWNHALYEKLEERFDIRRSYSMNRADFKTALEAKQFGDFVAMYRPFWNTGGEMGNWDEDLMYARYCDTVTFGIFTQETQLITSHFLQDLRQRRSRFRLGRHKTSGQERRSLLQCRGRMHRISRRCSHMARFEQLPQLHL